MTNNYSNVKNDAETSDPTSQNYRKIVNNKAHEKCRECEDEPSTKTDFK